MLVVCRLEVARWATLKFHKVQFSFSNITEYRPTDTRGPHLQVFTRRTGNLVLLPSSSYPLLAAPGQKGIGKNVYTECTTDVAGKCLVGWFVVF